MQWLYHERMVHNKLTPLLHGSFCCLCNRLSEPSACLCAVKKLKLSYYNAESLVFPIYTQIMVTLLPKPYIPVFWGRDSYTHTMVILNAMYPICPIYTHSMVI